MARNKRKTLFKVGTKRKEICKWESCRKRFLQLNVSSRKHHFVFMLQINLLNKELPLKTKSFSFVLKGGFSKYTTMIFWLLILLVLSYICSISKKRHRFKKVYMWKRNTFWPFLGKTQTNFYKYASCKHKCVKRSQ